MKRIQKPTSRNNLADQRSQPSSPGTLGKLEINDSIVAGDIKFQTGSNLKNCCQSGKYGRTRCSKCTVIFCNDCNPRPYLDVNQRIFSLYFYCKNIIKEHGVFSEEAARNITQSCKSMAIGVKECWTRHFENLPIAFVPSSVNTLNIGPFCEFHFQEELNFMYEGLLLRDQRLSAQSIRQAEMQEDYTRFRENNPTREDKRKALKDAQDNQDPNSWTMGGLYYSSMTADWRIGDWHPNDLDNIFDEIFDND